MVPPKPSAAKTWYQTISEKLPHHFNLGYWKNNKPFLCTLYLIIGVNILLMVQRAYYFKDFAMLNGYTPNVFYMISRACGKYNIIGIQYNSRDWRAHHKKSNLSISYYGVALLNAMIECLKVVSDVDCRVS